MATRSGNRNKLRKLTQDNEPVVDMNELVTKLTGFPQGPPPLQPLKPGEYDTQIQGIKKLLNNISSETLTKTWEGGKTLLDAFDPSKHTLPYSYALVATCSEAQGKARKAVKELQPGGALWQKVVGFLESFDPIQIRYAGPQYLYAVERIYFGAWDTEPQLGIAPIRTAMLRLDHSTETLTSVHRMFAYLCLLSKSYSEALPILENDIYHFPSATNPMFRNKMRPVCATHEFSSAYITASSGHSKKLNHRIVLEYYMYAAMIYMCLKNWERALFFLEACITMPTQGVASMIQVEAYRKYLLVGLIHTGQPLQLPKGTNTQAARAMKSLSRPYEAIAEIFKSGTQERLLTEIEAGMDIWQAEHNASLLLQVFRSYRKYALIRLSSTYAALSMPTIMSLIPPSQTHASNPTETETYIANLIASGALSGVLIPGPTPSEPAILRFTSPSTDEGGLEYEEKVEKLLAERTKEIKLIARHMHAVGETLEMSREYVEWVHKLQKGKENGEGKNGQMDIQNLTGGFDYSSTPFADDDEDVMGDL